MIVTTTAHTEMRLGEQVRHKGSWLLPQKAILKVNSQAAARKCLVRSTVRTAWGNGDHYIAPTFLAGWGAEIKYFIPFCSYFQNVKRRKSEGEILIAGLGIADN